MHRVLEWKAARKISDRLNAEGKLLITTNGCFDVLHRGHVSYLEQARALGDFLIVGLNSDDSVKKLKGENRPINSAEDRAFVLSALECVDAVCIFSEETPVQWLQTIRPKLHVKGGDYKVEELPENQAMKEWGGSVRTLPFVNGFSTSSTIERMKKS